MNRRIRILICMEDLCFGGTQRQTLALAERLNRNDFDPSFLVMTGKTDLDEIPLTQGLPVTYLGRGRGVCPFFFLTMGRAILASKPDLLFPCTALPNIWARLWGRVLGIPVIGTCRGGGGPKRQHERFLWRLTAHMICNSLALRDILTGLGMPEGRLSYIPNGCDTAHFSSHTLPPSRRPPLLLCVARLCDDKNHLTLLRAFARLHERFPEARLRMVGDGPMEGTLKEWALRHPSLPIEFVPGVGDVRPHYEEARLFVLTSKREGQPNVLLEAMSMGLPVCASRVGGIPALVRHEETGLLADPSDPESFVSILARLLENPDMGDSMGKKGREYVESHHSFSVMVAAHEAIFRRFASFSETL
ncbi:MAG: glycosyltransferase family 4 protein [Desulfovibrio sp.]|nr:glycosyltransferase family 4 protein [Desulfovibrio sp.]